MDRRVKENLFSRLIDTGFTTTISSKTVRPREVPIAIGDPLL